MLNVRNLEREGVKTVIISDEPGGRDGASPRLADWVSECDAMVSVGNTHELLAIPADVDKFIGIYNPYSAASAVEFCSFLF
jgi:glycine reductase